MLAIRMQRTGRSGHAQFRVIVQDSKFSPTRGRVVSYLGSYNPHTKEVKLDAVKASEYLGNGAQPSDTVARLFKKEGIKLPDWVKLDEPKKREIRNPDKRRSTRQEEAPAPAEPAAEIETPAESPEETPATEPETAAEPETAPESSAAETPPAEPAAETEQPASEES
jgi:small subunit ribosomal protein S16